MALGLERAGFTHLLLNEFDMSAIATLQTNRPEWDVLSRDIRDVDFSHLRGRVDVLEGGFPCQAFSVAGKRLGFRDLRGMMFYEFGRAVNEIRPKVVVGENVKGLLSHDGGMTLKLMVAVLQMLGYRVAYRVLRSQYLDVPQKRERLLIVAVRKEVNAPILFPRERDYTVPLKEAIGDRPASEGLTYPAERRRVLELVPEGGNWRDLPDDIKRDYLKTDLHRGNVASGVARRLSWEKPCPTLLCEPYQKRTELCHPSETRPLNIREYARIQTFPDDWTFQGSVSARYRQIGNAVPVNLGFHIGSAVTAMLEGAVSAEFVLVDELSAVVRHG